MQPWKNIGAVDYMDPTQIYRDFFMNHFSVSNHLRVAVDCGGASMVRSAPNIVKNIGIDIVEVFCESDPTFSVRPSDPKPDNLGTLVTTVKENRCDFGVAFDGDGDRSVIVDDTGYVLSADQTGIIIGKHGLAETKGTIIANVECSKAVEEQLKPLGYHIKKIEVGHTFLTLHAKKEHAVLGIESSGHLIIPHYFLFDDALIIPMKIAEILDITGKKLSSLRKDIPVYPRKKLEISCEDEIKFKVIARLQDDLGIEYPDINTMDGVRVDLDHGWVLIRASNTSPIIRLTTEADSKTGAATIAKTFQEKTQAIIDMMIQ
jgi:phosphomannomutase